MKIGGSVEMSSGLCKTAAFDYLAVTRLALEYLMTGINIYNFTDIVERYKIN